MWAKIVNSLVGSAYAATVTVMLVMWIVTLTLQCMGYNFVSKDHDYIIGALLLALKVHSSPPAQPVDTKPPKEVE